MLRNWYAVYTKPQRQKKVSALLTRKGIENFCPINHIVKQNSGTRKVTLEPLFNSYLFINAAETEITFIRNLPHVVNLLYWKSKPAIISTAEIDVLKQLTSGYMNIKQEKIAVNWNNGVRVIDQPVFAYSENAVSVKYKILTVELPSLGYMLAAERLIATEQIAQPEGNQFFQLPKRISALFY